MAVVSLKAVERTPGRKGRARRLRMEGRVPAVLYGIGEVPKPLSLNVDDLVLMLRKHGGSSIIVDLEIEGERENRSRALVKEVQRHTVTGDLLHVDLQRVSAERKLAVDVPLVLLGSARGVKEGGVVETVLREVRVQCLPADIPEKVEVDVTELGIGDSIHVRDLNLPGVEILNDPSSVVLTVVPPTVYEEVKAEAPEAAEPELVKKEKEKEEAEAGPEEKAQEKGKEKEKGKDKGKDKG